MTFKTADLYDAQPEALRVLAPGWRHFGGVRRFGGAIVTLKVHEDNLMLREQLEEPGEGRVIVIDGGGSLRCALVGDVMAQRAHDMGYAGCVVNGCVRDVVECARIGIGLMALAANPSRPKKVHGERGVRVAFGGVTFSPGEWLYADEDGVLVSARRLT